MSAVSEFRALDWITAQINCAAIDANSTSATKCSDFARFLRTLQAIGVTSKIEPKLPFSKWSLYLMTSCVA